MIFSFFIFQCKSKQNFKHLSENCSVSENDNIIMEFLVIIFIYYIRFNYFNWILRLLLHQK